LSAVKIGAIPPVPWQPEPKQLVVKMGTTSVVKLTGTVGSNGAGV
jgi:hypothetical protein